MGDSYGGSDRAPWLPSLPPTFHHDRGRGRLQLLPQLHAAQRCPGAAVSCVCLRMAITSKEAAADPNLKKALIKAYIEEIPRDPAAGPLKKGATILRRLPSYEQWALDILTHGDYDSYWKEHRGYAISEYYGSMPTFRLSI